MRELRTLADVDGFKVDAEKRFHSATHEEIAGGATTDVYFVKTVEILTEMGLADKPVVAEVFARRPGILAGVDECLHLLRDRGLVVSTLDEGANFADHEVVMRIEGPYGRFGPHETSLLGFLASASAWATAARRVREAAGDKPVVCFGARHVHPAVAPVMERAAIIGGTNGAACILGAKLAGLEPTGTVPHALFLLVGDTLEGALAYDRIMPAGSPRTILVDTFRDEVEESLRLAGSMGDRLSAVRLDTPGERGGVTPGLVAELRARLDQSGYRHVQIFASGGLDPERIAVLGKAGVDAFGVGSYISAAAPIDMTMDLKEVAGKPIAKRGRIPGITANPRLTRRL